MPHMKNILGTILTAVLWVYGITAATPDAVKCRIIRVENQGEAALVVGGAQKNGRVVTIDALSQHAVSEDIPFISCTDSRYYQSFLNDRPYVPEEALRIVCVATRAEWAIWRNERGVVCARVYEPGITSEQECGERLLDNPEVAIKKCAVITYIVSVDALRGSIVLRKIHAP